MAQIGYDPQEIASLCEKVGQVQGIVDSTVNEINALMNDLVSDRVFGDCQYKDTLVDTQKGIQASFETINTILANVVSKANTVGEKVGVSVKKSIMSVEEQKALIEAAAKKAGEA